MPPDAGRPGPPEADLSPAGTAPGPAGLASPPATGLTDVPTARARGLRYPALDGLRGVAAVVVVVFHALLLSPVFDDPDPSAAPGDVAWWFTHTPLALLWAGPQAVFLFFVLSGFVLALPATRGTIRWRAYFPQRLLRLYLPVWGSMLFAFALVVLVPRDPQPGLSAWYAVRPELPSLGKAIDNALLIFGGGWVNSPLWSLRWEVVFSLLLPVYLLAARVLPRLWPLKLAGCFGVIVAAAVLEIESVLYLTMFAFGVLLAFHQDRFSALASRIARTGALPWSVVAAAAVLLMTVETLLFAAGVGSTSLLDALAIALQVAGACTIVFLALHWPPLQRAMSVRSVQWLGVRSFSLYLVHEPVVVSLAALWPHSPLLVRLAVGLALSLLVAHAFHRLVEGPAHRLSREAGRRAAGREPVRRSG